MCQNDALVKKIDAVLGNFDPILALIFEKLAVDSQNLMLIRAEGTYHGALLCGSFILHKKACFSLKRAGKNKGNL